MLNLADTHCHLYFELFHEDLAEVIQRAKSRGIARILVPGIDLESSRQAVQLSEQFDELYAAVGVHPNDALTWTPQTLDALRELADHPKVLAIGEIGLDYYRDFAPKQLQIEILKEQLKLAENLSLPVAIHNRQSFHDLWPILSNWQKNLSNIGSPLAERPGVLHSYDGNSQESDKAIQQNFLIGVSGPVTFKNAPDRRETIAAIPLNHLILETDAPYLSPHPFRGRRNEPCRIETIAEKVAELHNLPVTEIANITTKNASRLFNWDKLN